MLLMNNGNGYFFPSTVSTSILVSFCFSERLLFNLRQDGPVALIPRLVLQKSSGIIMCVARETSGNVSKAGLQREFRNVFV